MTDYSAKYKVNTWYGWGGGDYNFHPESTVEVITYNCGHCSADILPARQADWQTTPGRSSRIIAFRLLKEYVPPREFWLLRLPVGTAVSEKKMPVSEGWIHVREALE